MKWKFWQKDESEAARVIQAVISRLQVNYDGAMADLGMKATTRQEVARRAFVSFEQEVRGERGGAKARRKDGGLTSPAKLP